MLASSHVQKRKSPRIAGLCVSLRFVASRYLERRYPYGDSNPGYRTENPMS